MKGLSAVDLLFNHGPQSAALLHNLVEADQPTVQEIAPSRVPEPQMESGFAQQGFVAASSAL